MSRFFLSFWIVFFVLLNHLYAYQVSVVSMFKNEASYLKEWVEYHKLVGVEHFWLYDNQSTDSSREILRPYVEQGLVEVIDWPTASYGNWIVAQVQAFRNGIERAQGKSKWVAVIDIDEFILPMKEKTIIECLDKHFVGTCAVYVNWRNFGTNHVTVPSGEPILFQLTAASFRSHSDNAVGKSIVQPEKVRLKEIWYPHHFPLNLGCYYVNGSNVRMDFVGSILPTDGVHHDAYIRINHYVLRDEEFFQKRRLAKAEGSDRSLLLEHYDSFSRVQDRAIGNYIRKYHPEMYSKFWIKK